MLDCGLFQGRRGEAFLKNRGLGISRGIEEIESVVLSHAHLDHSGRLPCLVREGYSRTIWCTPATRDLCAVMLADSAHIQERDAEYLARHGRSHLEPLYDRDDAERTNRLMMGVPYHQWFEAADGVRVEFVDAGHILGSASLVIEVEDSKGVRRIAYSGDIGRINQPIIRDPEPPSGVNVVVMESTYGDRMHPASQEMRHMLGKIVRDTASRGGRILIPAFAVGRTQELLYDLHLLAREGAIPAIPIFVDSPLATRATRVFAQHVELFDVDEPLVESEGGNVFRFPLVRYTESVEKSKALNELRTPAVIIAGSGMAESGRILHHLRHGANDSRNTILIVGFQAADTLGRRIQEGQPELQILGETVPLRARVEVLEGYSAHADRAGLVQWLESVRNRSPELERVFLVHGEEKARRSLAEELKSRGFVVELPASGSRWEL